MNESCKKKNALQKNIAYLDLRSVWFDISAESCWINESKTACCKGHGCCPNNDSGFSLSHKYTTKFKSEAERAWNEKREKKKN